MEINKNFKINVQGAISLGLFLAYIAIPHLAALVRVDASCGDGSCMVDGLMKIHVILFIAAIFLFLATTLAIGLIVKNPWVSVLLACFILFFTNPNGWFIRELQEIQLWINIFFL